MGNTAANKFKDLTLIFSIEDETEGRTIHIGYCSKRSEFIFGYKDNVISAYSNSINQESFDQTMNRLDMEKLNSFVNKIDFLINTKKLKPLFTCPLEQLDHEKIALSYWRGSLARTQENLTALIDNKGKHDMFATASS